MPRRSLTSSPPQGWTLLPHLPGALKWEEPPGAWAGVLLGQYITDRKTSWTHRSLLVTLKACRRDLSP